MPKRHYRFWVYILASRSRTLYIGVTNNLQNRVAQHREQTPGAHTAKYQITRLVHFERFQYITNALTREKELKHWTRAQKIALIESTNPTWEELLPDKAAHIPSHTMPPNGTPTAPMTEQAQSRKQWSGRVHSLSRASASVALCLSLSPLHAQTTRCSQNTIDQLETASDNIQDWLALRSLFHRYQQCRVEDAEVETGVGDFVTHTLTRHWESLPTAANLFRQDPPFEPFVLASLNITERTEDLNRIDELARAHCPADLRITCQHIRRAIRDNN